MKKIVSLLFFLVVSGSLFAQQISWESITYAMHNDSVKLTTFPIQIREQLENWRRLRKGVMIGERDLVEPDFPVQTTNQLGAKLIWLHVRMENGFIEDLDKPIERTTKMAEQTGDSLMLSEIWSIAGLVCWLRGDYEQAATLTDKAYVVRHKLLGAAHPLCLGLLNNRALVKAESEPEDAIHDWENIIKQRPDNVLKRSVLFNLALNHTRLSRFDLAQQYLRIAGSLLQSDKDQAYALVFEASLYAAMHQPDSVRIYLKKAITQYRKVYPDKHPELARCYNKLAEQELNTGNYRLALQYVTLALDANSGQHTAHFFQHDIALESFFLRARIAEGKHYNKNLRLGELKQGVEDLKQCDSLINLLRNAKTSYADQLALGKIASQVYELGVELCLRLAAITAWSKKQEEQAFSFAEKNKATLLKQNLVRSNLLAFSDVPDSLMIKERFLRASLAFQEQKAIEFPEQQEYSDRVLQLRGELSAHFRYLEQHCPKYYQQRFVNPNISIQHIQKQLSDSTGLLSYFISPTRQRIHVFVVRNKKLRVVSRDLKEGWSGELKAFRNAIKLDAPKVWISAGNYLSEILLPARHLLRNCNQLIIIPDGILSTIPFDALFTRKTRELDTLPNLLVNNYCISYDYAAGLVDLEKRTTVKENSILLFAPVHFDLEDKIRPLPGTEVEVNEVASSFKQHRQKSTFLVQQDASLEQLNKALIGNFNFIHLATHGVADEENPELSRIYTRQKNDPGAMYLADIYRCQINANLVVLSGCQTAAGKLHQGEGVVGLSRAWKYAGAKQVLSSLWNVPDLSTAKLMSFFYDEILKGSATDSALQRAKLRLMELPEYRSPRYWSPFVLIGMN